MMIANIAVLGAALMSSYVALQTAPQTEARETTATQPVVQATTQTAAAETAIRVRVVSLYGDVTHKTSADAKPQKCKADDEYFAPTTIQTGLYSSVKLRFGDEEPETLVTIEAGSTVDLAQASIVKGTKTTRIGLGYGKVRAGVAEGGIQSDFTVETPNATLSKRGTWNYGIEYERGTGRYRAFVLDRGLVSVVNKSNNVRREVAVGQTVTDAMRLWNDESQIQRNVPVPDVLGQEDIQVAFNRRNNSGLGLLQPGEGQRPVFDFTQRTDSGGFSFFNRRTSDLPVFTPAPQIQRNFPAIRRPEGDFGTGRGGDLLSTFIGSRSKVRAAFQRPVIRR